MGFVDKTSPCALSVLYIWQVIGSSVEGVNLSRVLLCFRPPEIHTTQTRTRSIVQTRHNHPAQFWDSLITIVIC